MRNLFAEYRGLTFEKKTVVNTIISLCFSFALAAGKFVVGLFADPALCIIALYTSALLVAKVQCLLGVKAGAAFKKRNVLVAVFMMISSVTYIFFMCATLFAQRTVRAHGLTYVVLLAFISFCELGFAVAGIFRTKSRGHFYRSIKIISFCTALIAILTTQTAILGFTDAGDAAPYNALTGGCVGVFIAACAVFILVAPKLSVAGREHNAYVLKNPSENKSVKEGAFQLLLCKSAVYGSYIYRAVFADGRLEGDIVRTPSLWKRMNIYCKILCCVLSEILVFAWLLGRAALFIRSANLPARLNKLLAEEGFEAEESRGKTDR